MQFLLFFLLGHHGLLRDTFLLYATLVPSWPSCFFFELPSWCHQKLLLCLLLGHLGLLKGPQCSYSMPPWCLLGRLALSLSRRLGANQLEVLLFLLLGHRGLFTPRCCYSMSPWCHIGRFALSVSRHLGANSKCSCSFCRALSVVSEGPQCFYSMPPSCRLGNICLVFE